MYLAFRNRLIDLVQHQKNWERKALYKKKKNVNLAVSVVHVGKHRGHHRCANSKRNLADSSKSLALVYITKHEALLMGRQCFKNKLETGSKKNESMYR